MSDSSTPWRTEIGKDIERAAALLKSGHVVGMPTETVYGLAAMFDDEAAVAEVFRAKDRPFFDPLIVHISEAVQLHDLVLAVPDVVSRLADEFWPGPLTFVLPKRECVPDLVTSGSPHVAVRLPGKSVTRKLIETVGRPLVAPSANLFGRTSPTTAEHVFDQLRGRIPYVLDAGPCEVGLESTILKVEGDQVFLLRYGGVPLEELQACVGDAGSIHVVTKASGNIQAPGQVAHHYAPRTPLYIWGGELPCPVETGAVAMMGMGELPISQLSNDVRLSKSIVLSEGDLKQAATRFFAAMRELDEADVDAILAVPFPDIGLGRAMNDRLRRAAATHAAAEESSSDSSSDSSLRSSD